MSETSGSSFDVVELILHDHRSFEGLFAVLRDVTADRSAARDELSALLVAHAEAEEKQVYPRLGKEGASTEDEVEHGEREHSHGHATLLVLLEVDDTLSDEFVDAVEELFAAITHHVNEEESTLLNDARTELDVEEREAIGRRFKSARDQKRRRDVGSLDHVRAIQDRIGLSKLDVETLRSLAAAQDIEGRSTASKQELVDELTG